VLPCCISKLMQPQPCCLSSTRPCCLKHKSSLPPPRLPLTPMLLSMSYVLTRDRTSPLVCLIATNQQDGGAPWTLLCTLLSFINKPSLCGAGPNVPQLCTIRMPVSRAFSSERAEMRLIKIELSRKMKSAFIHLLHAVDCPQKPSLVGDYCHPGARDS
jgi:hypothetical protein